LEACFGSDKNKGAFGDMRMLYNAKGGQEKENKGFL